MTNFLKGISFAIAVTVVSAHPQAWAQGDPNVPYQDLKHSSKVFGKDKSYRLYVPDGYNDGNERFPVVYFFHGWGGRHYMDPSAKLEYDMLKDLVDKYRVIMVMWDGNYEEEQPRPYNMGYHENITSEIQMKDYFPELIAHIDATYRTIPDREHRGIIGFSMGGMMSWFLAGKYPDKVCAAVNLTGSPEFFIGYPDNHTLLPLRYAFKNLKDVKIRLHNSTNGELVYLNTEVHKGALWEGGLAYSYEQFRGGHMVDDPGETKIFETAMKYVADAFRDPLPRSDRWWHYDFYPEFELWDYTVSTDKKEPGFVVLKRVSKNGFGIGSTRWLPDGPSIEGLKADVITAPLYEPNGTYTVVRYFSRSDKTATSSEKADASGRLRLTFDENTEVGIYKDTGQPDLIVADYSLDGGRRYLRPGKETDLTLRLFNRGGKKLKSLEVILTPQEESSFFVANNTVTATLPENGYIVPVSFRVRTTKTPPAHAEPAWIKLRVTMNADDEKIEDEVTLPVFFDVPRLEDVVVDDGKLIRDKSYGTGNGDGVAHAGEALMLYAGGHRLRLYTDDPYVVTSSERLADEVIPSRWPDGFTQTSIVKVAENCPDGHTIEFLASYETKDFDTIERNVTWRKVFLPVKKR